MEPSTDRFAKPGAGRPPELDELVFECLERVEREGAPALAELCQEHPELAAGLCERLAVLREAGLLEAPSAAGLARALGKRPPPATARRRSPRRLVLSLALVAAVTWALFERVQRQALAAELRTGLGELQDATALDPAAARARLLELLELVAR